MKTKIALTRLPVYIMNINGRNYQLSSYTSKYISTFILEYILLAYGATTTVYYARDIKANEWQYFKLNMEPTFAACYINDAETKYPLLCKLIYALGIIDYKLYYIGGAVVVDILRTSTPKPHAISTEERICIKEKMCTLLGIDNMDIFITTLSSRISKYIEGSGLPPIKSYVYDILDPFFNYV